jgi:hypothetical protein
MDSIEGSDPHLSETDIRERAHRIYQSRNLWEGDATSDWLQAERELIAEHQVCRSVTKTTPQRPVNRSRPRVAVDRVRSVDPQLGSEGVGRPDPVPERSAS